MFKYGFKLLIFFLPLMLLAAFVEYRVRTFSVPNNYTAKRAIVEKNIGTTQVFISGSSHAYYGILAKRLGVPAINLAYFSQDVYYDTRILLRYLPQAAEAKLVIVPISYFTLEYKLEQNLESSNRVNFYTKLWEIPPEKEKFDLAQYSSIVLFGFQPARNFALFGVMPKSEEMDETGSYVSKSISNLTNIKNAKAGIDEKHRTMKAESIPQNVRYLSELFEALRAKNISVVMLTTPCFRTYNEALDAERYARMQDEIRQLSEKYGIEYINYLKDERFVTEDFQDSSHLSTKGAEKFTDIIKDEIVRKYVK
jgi:Protein of unknown function (DUF1574)